MTAAGDLLTEATAFYHSAVQVLNAPRPKDDGCVCHSADCEPCCERRTERAERHGEVLALAALSQAASSLAMVAGLGAVQPRPIQIRPAPFGVGQAKDPR